MLGRLRSGVQAATRVSALRSVTRIQPAKAASGRGNCFDLNTYNYNLSNIRGFAGGVAQGTEAAVAASSFGKVETGDVSLYTLTNNQNMRVEIVSLGGHIRKLEVPNKNGELVDVVAGLDDIDAYDGGTEKNPYFGCITGRYANRICKGKFSINGKEYTLAINNDPNHLHGGLKGFDRQLWSLDSVIDTENEIGIRLNYISKDMDEGYPGELNINVEYTLDKENNKLNIRYNATTDSVDGTVINLTNHSYFNLLDTNDKFNENSILDTHEFNMKCKHITPIGSDLIPTGELMDVTDTPFDFYNKFVKVGANINDPNCDQLRNGGGFDHNFVIDSPNYREVVECTKVRCAQSGIEMSVLTNEPAIQLYSGNFLDGSHVGKGNTYQRRSAFCLETQHYPDSPNQPQFPSTFLKKGETYDSYTAYEFRTN